MANPWEIVGAGLRQTAQDVSAYGDRRRMFDDMVQRRIAAQQEQRRIEEEARLRQEEADRQKQKFEADQARVKVEQQEKDRALKVRQEIARGKEVPGKASGGVIEPDSFQPYSPEEANRMLLGSGDLSAKDYVESTLPPKPSNAAPIFKEGKDGFYHQYGPNGFEKTNLEAPPPATSDRPPRYVVQEIDGRKVRLNLDTGEQMDLGPVTAKTNAKSEAQARYDALPPEKQKQIDLLATALGKRQNTINELETALAEFKAAKTDLDRERIGGGMLKTLNSPENPDAIGVEEEARIGNALKFQKMNILGQGQVFGRDFPGFITQVQAKINAMQNSRAKNQQNIESLYSSESTDPREAKRQKWAEKNGSPKVGDTKKNRDGDTVRWNGSGWELAQ